MAPRLVLKGVALVSNTGASLNTSVSAAVSPIFRARSSVYIVTVGANVSIVSARTGLGAPWFPPWFSTTAIRLCAPGASALSFPTVIDHPPWVSILLSPSTVRPSYTTTFWVTSKLPSTLPVIVGFVLFVVVLSVVLKLAVAAGTSAVTLTTKDSLAFPWLPAVSTTLALRLREPLFKGGVKNVHVLSLELIVAMPRKLLPSRTSTCSLAPRVPMSVPLSAKVLSLLESPLPSGPILGFTLS